VDIDGSYVNPFSCSYSKKESVEKFRKERMKRRSSFQLRQTKLEILKKRSDFELKIWDETVDSKDNGNEYLELKNLIQKEYDFDLDNYDENNIIYHGSRFVSFNYSDISLKNLSQLISFKREEKAKREKEYIDLFELVSLSDYMKNNYALGPYLLTEDGKRRIKDRNEEREKRKKECIVNDNVREDKLTNDLYPVALEKKKISLLGNLMGQLENPDYF
jgi:hypothetical protein